MVLIRRAEQRTAVVLTGLSFIENGDKLQAKEERLYAGVMGLYGGLDVDDIHVRKELEFGEIQTVRGMMSW